MSNELMTPREVEKRLRAAACASFSLGTKIDGEPAYKKTLYWIAANQIAELQSQLPKTYTLEEFLELGYEGFGWVFSNHLSEAVLAKFNGKCFFTYNKKAAAFCSFLPIENLTHVQPLPKPAKQEGEV